MSTTARDASSRTSSRDREPSRGIPIDSECRFGRVQPCCHVRREGRRARQPHEAPRSFQRPIRGRELDRALEQRRRSFIGGSRQRGETGSLEPPSGEHDSLLSPQPVAEIRRKRRSGVERRRVVSADDLGYLVEVVRPGFLEPAGHPDVKTRALRAREARVADVAQERVSEDERLSQEVVCDGAGDDSPPLQRADAVSVVSSELAQCVAWELPSGHRCPADHRPRVLWEIVELRPVHALHGRGQFDVSDRALQPPPRRGSPEQPTADPGSEQLLDEQGIAARSLGKSVGELVRERVPDESTDELARRAERERFELENVAARDPVTVGIEKRRPGRADDEAPGAVGRRPQERPVVAPRPVDVFDQPDLGTFVEGRDSR